MKRPGLILLSALVLTSPAMAGNLFAKPKPPVPAGGLLVSGTIQGAKATLEPAFYTVGSSQREPGPYHLRFLDRAGRVLKEVPFDAMEDPMLDGFRSFTFVVPLDSRVKAAMVTLELRHGDNLLATLQGSNHQASVARLGAVPQARVVSPGVVRLTWPQATHPKVLVKDVATGEFIANASGGTIDLVTSARELELTLSDGLRSLIKRVHVN